MPHPTPHLPDIDLRTLTSTATPTPTIYADFPFVDPDTLSCYPTGFYTVTHPYFQEAGSAPLYSPAWACPAGHTTYRTGTFGDGGGGTRVYCCWLGYTTTYLNWCESRYLSSTTAVVYHYNPDGYHGTGPPATETVTVGPGVAYRRQIILEYGSQDVSYLSSLAVAASTTPTSMSSTPGPTPTRVETTSMDGVEKSTSARQTSTTTTASDKEGTPTTPSGGSPSTSQADTGGGGGLGLSTEAVVGIVFGVLATVIGVVTIVIMVYKDKHNDKRTVSARGRRRVVAWSSVI